MENENLTEQETIEKKDFPSSRRLNISITKYFWQASPLTGSRKKSVHRFFRKIPAFDDFSDIELYSFSKYLHLRDYSANEVIFKRGEGGFAFYIIFDGTVGITINDKIQIADPDKKIKFITELEKYNYFGELALLEDQNRRNATAIARTQSTVLAIYKPDLEELIEEHPVVAAKFIKALSYVVAKRLQVMATELKFYKDKVKESKKNE
jgi:CRP/FNR family cyclic AMP-dependent transcriptional regulator